MESVQASTIHTLRVARGVEELHYIGRSKGLDRGHGLSEPQVHGSF